ncbi:MAG: DNA internalization-related competence protein ComEC/Rec2 [Steroidobacteraceae bacterium]
MLPGIAFFIGHLLGLLACQPPAVEWCWLALLAAALCALQTRGSGTATATLLAAGIAGFAALSSTANTWLQLRLPESDHAERLLVHGEILTVPALAGDQATFDALVTVIAPRDRAASAPRKLRIRWRGAPTDLLAHETWQWLVRLDTVTRSRATLDLERIWLRDRVHALATVLPSRLNSRQRIAPRSIDALRERIGRAVDRHVVDRDAAALLRALAVGLTDRVTREQWRVFAATGTTHLVAISGLHVTLFALVAFAMARTIWRYLPAWALPVDREPFALWAGVAAALGYALLAGWSVPTQRTLLMLAVFATIQLQQRALSATRILLTALTGVLLIDALAPLASGLWLSFGAVATILWLEVPRVRRVPGWWSAMRVQTAIVLALAPATLVLFGSLSLSSLVVNAVAIPAVSFVFVPLVLLGSCAVLVWPTAGAWLLQSAEWLYLTGWPLLAGAAEWPLSKVTLAPPMWWYPLSLVGLTVALAPAPVRLRLASVAALLPLLATPRAAVAPGEVLATLHATGGRGALVVLQTANHTVLYDTGDSFRSAGMPLQTLLAAGEIGARDEHFDLVVLPRVTQDQAAGVGRLLARATIAELRGGGPWPGAVMPYQACADRQSHWFDQVRFQLLVAAADGKGEYCALDVTAGGQRLLLAGEFDLAAERDALLRASAAGASLASNVLLVSRGGSGAGSSDEWLRATAPRYALVTGPAPERATSPKALVLRRWRATGAQLWETRRTPVVRVRLGSANGVLVDSQSVSGYPFLWRRRQPDAAMSMPLP